MSVARDMSGLGSTRSVRGVWSLLERLDAPDGALQGARMISFRGVLDRYEASELSQIEAGELLGISERTFRR